MSQETATIKQTVLLKLMLRNFKGVRDFTLDLQGQDAQVYGDNEVGKTTLFDGFLWLLFDKDSQNKKDFSIKTLDRLGNVMHGLEHEVSGVLMINGRELDLRKVYTEKWTKKRGSAASEFTGHTTDYFIDGVPVDKKEYTDRVDDIVKDDIFKLLTSPSFFNELHWEKRRKILLEVCGDVPDYEVIESNKDLSRLPAILGDRSIENHRKVIAARRTEINKELEKIPVRIDEIVRSTPDIADLNEDELNRQIALHQTEIESKKAESSRIQLGGEVSVKENRIREIQGEMLEIKNQLQSNTSTIVSEKQTANFKVKEAIGNIGLDIQRKQQQIKRNQELVIVRNEEAESFRKEWRSASAEEFEHIHDDSCSACGQALPEDRVKAAHEKALAVFNQQKAARLEGIVAKGTASAAEIVRLEQDSVNLQDDIRQFSNQLQTKQEESQALITEIDKLQAGIKDVSADPQYIQKKQDIADIEQQIRVLRESVQESLDRVKDEIGKLGYKVYELEEHKAKFGQVRAINERTNELKKQEKELAAEFQRLEQELYLTEEFIRTKVTMLESKINSKFRYARFKLFDQQINGGVQEVCETLFKGVPYSSGLNNAARINVGLDIINTLSAHHHFSAPIFIDNAEAVTSLIDTNGQKICLVVSEPDKQLRVVKTNTMKEAVSIG